MSPARKKSTATRSGSKKTARKSSKKAAAGKKSGTRKTAARKTSRTTAKRSATRRAPKKTARKTAKKAAQRSTKRSAAKKTVRKPVKKTAARKSSRKTVARKSPKKTAATKAPAKKSAARKPARRPAAPKPHKFDRKTLERIRTQLRDELEGLERQQAELEDSSFDSTQSDMTGEMGIDEDYADAGTATFDRERDLSIRNNISDLITQITRALEKIDEGSYGNCEHCGRPINAARLQALPHALLCMDCKRRDERSR